MIQSFIDEISLKLNTWNSFRFFLSQCSKGEFPLSISGAQEGLLPLLIHEVFSHTSYHSLIITPTVQEAENLFEDLKLLDREKVELFPWWGTAPYKKNLPMSSAFFSRSSVLSHLVSGERFLTVVPLRSFLVPLPDPASIKSRLICIEKGKKIDITRLISILQEYGYLRVPRVSVKGEFALRGEVIDIFPPNRNTGTDGDTGIRIVFEYDEIEELKTFDPFTQGSLKQLDSIILSPLREVIFNQDMMAILKKNLLNQNIPEEYAEDFIEKLTRNPEETGAEMFYPLCFEKKYSLLDYLPPDALLYITWSEKCGTHSKVIQKEYRELYKTASLEKKVLPLPESIVLDYEQLSASFSRKIQFHAFKGIQKETEIIHITSTPPRSFFGNISYLKEELTNLLKAGYSIYVFAVYPAQAERLKTIFKDFDITILDESISNGFGIPELKVIVISEREIFGRKKHIPRSIKTAKSTVIDSFVDLEPGDYVVHINYGIGFFRGIERIKTSLNERDYIHLEYADEEMIYIPIEQVNLIQRYITQGGRHPKLDKIAGKGWELRKARVRKSVEDLADMLIALYAERIKAKGFAFPEDTGWQKDFEAGFPYQETDDQLTCIREVKKNMEEPVPMDRLVCGDAGYGKTEVALRAAFKAIMGGKQVAVLTPTTILAEQHFETFKERFKDFPAHIEMLSRFRAKKEQKTIIAGLDKGSIDIIIGTHRLVQKDVKFKNLGLLVIDEEQRFGVKQKELLKELKTSVDCLTLTATPIPRTLHMALTRIRDMSILNTPPQNRLPIETFVLEFNQEIISLAIRKEVERGGQVFFLHNRIETLPQVYHFLQDLVPDYSIVMAHGRMAAFELEEVMRRFVHNEVHILLSTSIIENGLDIPNVNTIIIDRADMFGVSQLYQIRGRVGRSDVPAYAYLLYPKERAMNEIAMKRLKIISDYTELGSGFKIALKDLEIRGAGNLLGKEQHGDILAVGMDMYVKLLDEVIAEKKNEKKKKEEDVFLELEYSGYVPDSYISEPIEKMEVYKKIASISDEQELETMYAEIIDRFGPPPAEVISILSIAEIRIFCKKLSISSLKEKDGVISVEFSNVAKVSVDKVVRLITESGGNIYLDKKRPNWLFLRIKNIGLKEKAEYLRDTLSRIV
ncbi:MAG: transcription-repair coupling factor [Spirochaetales bacterium]|nr:transcription-repair coupling factor [Spirochaetales bacterium]